MIEKITRIPLRDAFKHEAFNFTKWLQDNLDVLNDVTDLALSNAEREKSAGDFSVDLVAEMEGGHKAIIENQLERSNHDESMPFVVELRKRSPVWHYAA